MPWFFCYNSYLLMDILSKMKEGIRSLSLSKRALIFKGWETHILLWDANQPNIQMIEGEMMLGDEHIM